MLCTIVEWHRKKLSIDQLPQSHPYTQEGQWRSSLQMCARWFLPFISVETLGVLLNPDGLLYVCNCPITFLLHQPHTIPVHHMESIWIRKCASLSTEMKEEGTTYLTSVYDNDLLLLQLSSSEDEVGGGYLTDSSCESLQPPCDNCAQHIQHLNCDFH